MLQPSVVDDDTQNGREWYPVRVEYAESAVKRTRLRIIYDRVGWAYFHRAAILQKYAPEDFEVSIASQYEINEGVGAQPVDVVLLLNYTRAPKTRRALDSVAPDVRLVASFNTGWPRRLRHFEECCESCEAVLVNNHEYWDQAGQRSHTFYVPNGVDRTVFNTQVGPVERKERVLWCGSEYHLGLKGYDDYLVPLAAKLSQHQMPCDFLVTKSDEQAELRTPEEMARWYNSGTIYVCASEFEGTPNTCLEAAACGGVVVSTRVGNMPEFIQHGVNGFLVSRDVESMVNAVLSARERYSQLSAEAVQTTRQWDWKNRSREYFDLLRRLFS